MEADLSSMMSSQLSRKTFLLLTVEPMIRSWTYPVHGVTASSPASRVTGSRCPLSRKDERAECRHVKPIGTAHGSVQCMKLFCIS